MDEKTGFETRSILAVPMHTHDRTIGVLEVINKREGSFDEGDLKLATALANHAAIAIDNAQPLRPARGRGRHLADVVPPLRGVVSRSPPSEHGRTR